MTQEQRQRWLAAGQQELSWQAAYAHITVLCGLPQHLALGGDAWLEAFWGWAVSNLDDEYKDYQTRRSMTALALCVVVEGYFSSWSFRRLIMDFAARDKALAEVEAARIEYKQSHRKAIEAGRVWDAGREVRNVPNAIPKPITDVTTEVPSIEVAGYKSAPGTGQQPQPNPQKRSANVLNKHEQDELALGAARQAIVLPILKLKRWTRGRWATKAGVGKNSVYEYLKGTRKLSDDNRKAMAGVLGLRPEQLLN